MPSTTPKRRAKPKTPAAPMVAILDYIADNGWRAANPSALAESLGLPLADIVALIGGLDGILPALNRIVDSTVVADGPAESAAPARERLFDVLMRRFDALAPFKPGLQALNADRIAAACLAPSAGPSLVDSMAQMLALAGLDQSGPKGRLRAAALAAIWLVIARSWMTDDSPDLTRTMAAVDRQLGKIERWL